ncbi:NUDIX domain-containing protein [Paenibacillus thailandensis]|uniref:NUDIX domain-containing protein n=1 Tax=Paenibacillus thailandensis TaxID=393250 RepID=A0ABW5R1B8_9BACL
MAEERFDIYDDGMNPIGTAARSETHARGYWHRSFHCWLARREADRLLVRFQQRQSGKDTYPGYYDITAAGHLAAGETTRDAVRELEEELGVSATYEQLVPLGEVREELRGFAKGVPFIDREVSEVYGLWCDVPLSGLRLQAEEVAAVYEADLAELLALFEGTVSAIDAEGVELRLSEDGARSLRPARASVTAAQFVPRDASYYAYVLRALQASASV